MAVTACWLACVATVGCMSMAEMAPPIDDRIGAIARSHGIDPASLGIGRHIYLTRCSRCHSIEPIDRYTLDQWEMILPEMSIQARLNESQLRDLTRYITTIRRVQSTGTLAEIGGS